MKEKDRGRYGQERKKETIGSQLKSRGENPFIVWGKNRRQVKFFGRHNQGAKNFLEFKRMQAWCKSPVIEVRNAPYITCILEHQKEG